MKKFIFTAIAMVVFSGVSMAGTLDKQTELSAMPKQTCMQKAIAYTLILYPDQANTTIEQQIEINQIFQAFLDGCKS